MESSSDTSPVYTGKPKDLLSPKKSKIIFDPLKIIYLQYELVFVVCGYKRQLRDHPKNSGFEANRFATVIFWRCVIAGPPFPSLNPIPLTNNADNLRGIAFMAGGLFLFAAVDAHAKFLTGSLHPIQIAWSRQLGLLLGVLIYLALRGRDVLRTQHPFLQMARGALAAGSATFFIVGISFVPLADAVALSFVAPFLVTLMGALILREKVGIRRWVAVAIGFIGMLIVTRPGMGVIHPAAVLILVAAFLFALRQILSRKLSGSDRTMTTVAYTALTASAVLTFPLPFVWQMPELGIEIALLVSMAILAGLAEIMVIKSLELAEAVVLAPVHYSLLIWGTFYGWLVFNQLPDLWTWVGASIIVATGIYTLYREKQVAARL